MPTTSNKNYQQVRTFPEGIALNTEVFFQPLSNEVFLDYEEYFERMIQLNSACWTCSITGKNGLTYEEALDSEKDAIEQINQFPGFLELPILFLIHRFTCRARIDELVSDIMTFMRDRYFMDEEVVYRHSPRQRLLARVIGINYQPELEGQSDKLDSKVPKSPNKSPSKKENEQSGLKLCPAECFTYTLQILNMEGHSDSEISSNSDDDDNGHAKAKMPGQVFHISHTQIGRGKENHATRSRIKLFIRYYTEMAADGRMIVKQSMVDDLSLNTHRWSQVFAKCPEPTFPETRSSKKSKLDRLSSVVSQQPKEQKTKQNETFSMKPGTSKQVIQHQEVFNNSKAKSTESVKKGEIRRKQIIEQQAQLESLFKHADRVGVENISRWRQTFMYLPEDDIQELRKAIADAKETERQKQIEHKKREREALIEWRKPRDDLLCDDLKVFPEYKELIWPDWVPRRLYWDILSIQSFFDNFADVLFHDRRNPFTLTNIATAIVSKQVAENTSFYQILDWLLTALNRSMEEDEGAPADLNRPEHIGNEAAKDIDHIVHGRNIRQINHECEKQKKIHGTHVYKFTWTLLSITEIIRLHLKTSGFYTMYRRQRGNMHCYEDDGYQFVRSEQKIMELLEKSSIFALNSKQRIKLVNTLINQLLSHQRCRNLIDKRIEKLNELRRDYRHLKAVDQQHEREAREAQQLLQQQNKTKAENSAETDNAKATSKGALKELCNLRRALIQMNEGRRVQNISEVKERMVDEKHPLPWTLMEDINEIHEFRTVQRSFHNDKLQEKLRKIYELQGRMGLFYLGRDRAFRTYYYICSTFIIYCPNITELGQCGDNDNIENDIKHEEFANDDDDIVGSQKAKNNDEKCEEEQQNGLERMVEDDKSNKNVENPKKRIVDPMMACTGKRGKCPVHNPPPDQPKLYYYIEKDAVKKLLHALNLRGYRESELADNIGLFKDIYENEINNIMDSLAERKTQLSESEQLFGFSTSLPKELAKENPNIDITLWKEVFNDLLEIEKIMNEKQLGAPHCTVDREQWRKCLEENWDTSHLCVGNCLKLENTSNGGKYLYTTEELNAQNGLTIVQKLGIALIQLADGIRPECMQSPFMNETKKNGEVIKRTPSQAYIEWKRALKGCQSPSAIALFQTTFECSVNWNFNRLEKDEQQHTNGRHRSTVKKEAPSTTVSRSNNGVHDNQPQTSSKAYHPRSFREAEQLMENANHAGLLVSGTRTRKPVTKYGECEMDLDKLNLDEDYDEERKGRNGNQSSNEEDGWGTDDEEEETENLTDDEETEDREEGYDSDDLIPNKRRLRSNRDQHFDNIGAERYEGLARKRKAVTHFDPTNYNGKTKRQYMEGEDNEDEEDDVDNVDGSEKGENDRDMDDQTRNTPFF